LADSAQRGRPEAAIAIRLIYLPHFNDCVALSRTVSTLRDVNLQLCKLSLVTLTLFPLLTACAAGGADSMDGADSADSMDSQDSVDTTESADAGGTTNGTDTSDTTDTSDASGTDTDTSETSDTGEPGTAVDLGEAGEFAILAKSGISTVPTSAVTGDVGVSPAAATYLTGFSLTMDVTDTFSTSPQVTGNLYASDYAPPTPANLTAAIGDMELAFTDAAGRAPDVTELGAGNISGMTLEPGVYAWGTSLGISTDIWLEGSDTDVWIFQISGDLTMSSGAQVVLTGGALPENVFWQVAGLVELGTTAHVEGIVLTQTSITLSTGSSINGRLLAQTAISLDSSTVVEP
jgi:Ice-binding-like